MKTVLLCMLMVLLPAVCGATHTNANDDSTTAGERASCNASFQEDCPVEHTEEAESHSVAAPIGITGSTTVEAVIMVFLMILTIRLRLLKTSGRFTNELAGCSNRK
jgi:hypothetical protein